jgi:hypothetical protein
VFAPEVIPGPLQLNETGEELVVTITCEVGLIHVIGLDEDTVTTGPPLF